MNQVPDPTSDLLDRARAGDERALNELFERHIPRLRRWASGRLPRWARDIVDTSDVVQDTVIESLKHLQGFEHRGHGALQAYLRQAIINRIRNQLRRLAVRPASTVLESAVPTGAASPLERAIANETFARYEAGLEQLGEDERDAVVARVELGLSYAEIADVTGKPTANAARMTVVRALVRLARAMKTDRT